MARTGSTVERTDAATAATPQQALPTDGDFGAEFRELARQRRFVRSDEPSDPAATAAPTSTDDRQVEDWRRRAADATARAGSWRAEVAPARTPAPPELQPQELPMPALPPAPAARPLAPSDPRLTDDLHATLRELARMSDRLVQSREQLAATTTRVEQLTGELEQAQAKVRAADERLLASRVLVQDAQRTTHELAERCAWLEGRCEMLGEALELAVNASWLTRWRWRREQRARG